MQDHDLIQHYLAGNNDSLEELLERHLQKIFGACFRVCLNEDDANDVTQNVLIKIIKNLSKFKKESSFSTWYFRIAYNESVNFLKKQKWHVDVDEIADFLPWENNTVEEIDEKLLSQEVTKEIHNLPLIERNIILYYYYEGLKLREIAQIMDMNENTLKTRLTKAKRLLSPKLSHYENAY